MNGRPTRGEIDRFERFHAEQLGLFDQAAPPLGCDPLELRDCAETAPFVLDSDTSEAGAEFVAPRLNEKQRVQLALLREHGGLADFESQALTGWCSSTQEPRRIELRDVGLARWSGEKRKSPRGKLAKVWEAPAPGKRFPIPPKPKRSARAVEKTASPDAARLRPAHREILCRLEEVGRATDQELQDDLGMQQGAERARRWELVRWGLVRDSGRTRRTSRSCNAILWERI